MKQTDIDRINALARKAKAEGLTETEKEEQAVLRRAYIEEYRQSLTSQLNSIVIQEADGSTHPLKKKPKS